MEEVGRCQEVLVEGESRKEDGLLLGRNRGNKLVMFAGGGDLRGEIVKVRITGAQLAHLSGEIVET